MTIASFDPAPNLRSLASVGWLGEQPAAFKNRIAKIGRWINIRRGQVVYAVGDEADAIYGLGHGLLDVAIPIDDERQVVIHRATAGFWIGDSALLAGSVRTITLSAAATVSCSKFLQLQFTAISKNIRKIGFAFIASAI